MPDGNGWENVVDRLRTVGLRLQVMDYPTDEPIVGVQVHDPDQIALELQAPRSAVRPEFLAGLAEAV